MRRTVLALLLITLPFFGLRSQIRSGSSGTTSPLAVAGPANAPVTAIVFSDFACPYSAQMSYVLDRLEKRYPAQLRVVFRQSPLSIHPDAPLAHRAALAAGEQGRYEAMSDLLYGNQKHQDAAFIDAYARQLHLDMRRFHRDMDSPVIAAKLAADMEESRGLAVQSTPTVYINGKALVGFQTEEILARTIDAALKQTGTPKPNAIAEEQPTLGKEVAAQLAVSPTAVSGDSDAPLTIVEFTDFQCPFCKAAVAPMQQLLAERGRQVRWVFRAFPLDFHPDAQLAAEAALAAGAQGKFWQMHDLLFAHQDALKQADLMNYAEQVRLDMTRFRRDLDTHAFAGQVAADRALGSRAGVNGTPTFFVDDKMITGVRSLPELRQIADAHLPATSKQTATVVKPAIVTDRTIAGNEGAPLTITWYTDVRSPSAERQAELLRNLMAMYGKRVHVLYRAFPLDAYPDAVLAGQALIAAQAQGSFWPMWEYLAHHREPISNTTAVKAAVDLGLNPAAFANSFEAAPAEVTTQRAEAERRGIRGAPVIYLNDRRVDGLQEVRMYTMIADEELAKVQQASR